MAARHRQISVFGGLSTVFQYFFWSIWCGVQQTVYEIHVDVVTHEVLDFPGFLRHLRHGCNGKACYLAAKAHDTKGERGTDNRQPEDWSGIESRKVLLGHVC